VVPVPHARRVASGSDSPSPPPAKLDRAASYSAHISAQVKQEQRPIRGEHGSNHHLPARPVGLPRDRSRAERALSGALGRLLVPDERRGGAATAPKRCGPRNGPLLAGKGHQLCTDSLTFSRRCSPARITGKANYSTRAPRPMQTATCVVLGANHPSCGRRPAFSVVRAVTANW
jgi:hypothetical protein